MMTIKLIVGLGNIGTIYSGTRHNYGAEYIRYLTRNYNISLRKCHKLCGYHGQLKLNNNIVQLLIPDSYINNSGISVLKCVNFFQLSLEEILIAHDDFDLLPGMVRVKLGKNNKDSHNGIRNIITKFNNKPNFYRLRIGIGKSKNKHQIVNFVLGHPSTCERTVIDNVLKKTIQYTENIINKDFIKVMNALHTKKISNLL